MTFFKLKCSKFVPLNIKDFMAQNVAVCLPKGNSRKV